VARTLDRLERGDDDAGPETARDLGLKDRVRTSRPRLTPWGIGTGTPFILKVVISNSIGSGLGVWNPMTPQNELFISRMNTELADTLCCCD
jgi:hypothetical protein